MNRHNSQKASWFCGVTRSPADMANLISNIAEMFYYAYIIHDSDGTDNHIHWIGNIAGSRSIKSIAEMLNIDPQYMQICKTPKGASRYLLHLDNPEKFQYNLDQIVTSDLDRFKTFIKTERKASTTELFLDFERMKKGIITRSDFIALYEGDIGCLNFYQKISLFDKIYNI